MGLLEDICTAGVWGTEWPADAGWIEWKHISRGFTHCKTCLRLDKCWFTNQNKPREPQHPHCHCMTDPIPFSQVLNEASVECRYSKFDPYLFDIYGEYKHGKERMFKSWGYSVEDSEWLRSEFEKQGLEKYIAGEYTLGKLDKNGQRINIMIEIERKDKKEMVSFISGWMVYANGLIALNTPYGGK